MSEYLIDGEIVNINDTIKNVIKIHGLVFWVQKVLEILQIHHEEVEERLKIKIHDWSVEEEADVEGLYENAVITYYNEKFERLSFAILKEIAETTNKFDDDNIPFEITYSYAYDDRESGGTIITFDESGEIDEETGYGMEFACEIFGENINEWRIDNYTIKHEHDLKREMFVDTDFAYCFDVDCETLVFDFEIPQMYNQDIACRANEETFGRLYNQPHIEFNENDKIKMIFDIGVTEGVLYITAIIKANDESVATIILNRDEIQVIRKYIEKTLEKDLCDLYNELSEFIDYMGEIRGY